MTTKHYRTAAASFVFVAMTLGCGNAPPAEEPARATAAPAAASAPSSASPIVADLRAFLEAQRAFAERNKGLFAEPPCLVTPGKCLPQYPADGPGFLDPERASMRTRYSYALTFLPGPFVTAEEAAARGAGTPSVHAFAVVAAPTIAGQPSYCVDSTGVLCSRADGKMSRPFNGRCPSDCPPLP
jgi:hypothetical protein